MRWAFLFFPKITVLAVTSVIRASRDCGVSFGVIELIICLSIGFEAVSILSRMTHKGVDEHASKGNRNPQLRVPVASEQVRNDCDRMEEGEYLSTCLRKTSRSEISLRWS